MESTQQKAVSPIIAAVLLMAMVFSIAAIVSPWMNTLTQDVTNETSSTVKGQIICQSAGYDFDTSYATSGINANITDDGDALDVKIVNTGTVNLHTFSIELEIISSSGLEVKQFPVNDTYQKTTAMPLRPGQGAILKANLTENLNGTLTEVKVLNGVCPGRALSQSV